MENSSYDADTISNLVRNSVSAIFVCAERSPSSVEFACPRCADRLSMEFIEVIKIATSELSEPITASEFVSLIFNDPRSTVIIQAMQPTKPAVS